MKKMELYALIGFWGFAFAVVALLAVAWLVRRARRRALLEKEKALLPDASALSDNRDVIDPSHANGAAATVGRCRLLSA